MIYEDDDYISKRQQDDVIADHIFSSAYVHKQRKQVLWCVYLRSQFAPYFKLAIVIVSERLYRLE